VDDSDRVRLLFGPYSHPSLSYGDEVPCQVRGGVGIVGLSDGPIPWPVGKRGRAKGLVVYAGLADAVRRESAQAVAHWWGVTPQTVGVWRKALGVCALTEGTRRLKRDHALEPGIAAAREKAVGRAGDPERRRKIAVAMRGKAKPPHVVDAMSRGRTEAAKKRRAVE
jgi:hypothetical protein